MDLTFSREEEAFRERVRSFIAEHLPARLKGRTRRDLATKEDYLDWHRTLYRKGWVAPLWPKEYAARIGASPSATFSTRSARVPRRRRSFPFGLAMVGPVIYTFGNAAQKQKFLPRILPATTGGARVIPSRAPVRTLPA